MILKEVLFPEDFRRDAIVIKEASVSDFNVKSFTGLCYSGLYLLILSKVRAMRHQNGKEIVVAMRREFPRKYSMGPTRYSYQIDLTSSHDLYFCRSPEAYKARIA